MGDVTDSKTETAARLGIKVIKAVRFKRVVKAPRKLVFDVWTKPEHLSRWFSPNGYTVEGVQSDPRPGSSLKLIMVPHWRRHRLLVGQKIPRGRSPASHRHARGRRRR